MTVHPVAVNVTLLAIVVTLWRASDASFLVQVSKIRANEIHNFGMSVLEQDQQIGNNCILSILQCAIKTTAATEPPEPAAAAAARWVGGEVQLKIKHCLKG